MVRTVRSLQGMLNASVQHEPEEICRFYNETIHYLNRYAVENQSKFISEKTASLPQLSQNDFPGHGVFFHGFAGIFASMLRSEIKQKKVDEKLSLIRQNLFSIVEVIENPELETMYFKA